MNSIEEQIEAVRRKSRILIQKYGRSRSDRKFMRYLASYLEQQRLILLCASLMFHQTDAAEIRRYFTEQTIRKSEILSAEYASRHMEI